MKQFHLLLNDILTNGRWSGNRTGNPTIKVFGRQLRFDMKEGFPLTTCSKLYTHGIFKELEWFIQGDTSSKTLEDANVNIWRDWALTDGDVNGLSKVPLSDHQRWVKYMDVFKETHSKEEFEAEIIRFEKKLSREEGLAIFDAADIPNFYTYSELGFKVGDLGPIYGKQWTAWKCPDGSVINQLLDRERELIANPNSRRLIVSAWNPADLPDESVTPQENVLNGKMALAACHTMFQLFTDEATLEERYDYFCEMYRGADGVVRLEEDYLEREVECLASLKDSSEDHFFIYRNDAQVVLNAQKLTALLDSYGAPRHRLSLMLFQRKTCALLA